MPTLENVAAGCYFMAVVIVVLVWATYNHCTRICRLEKFHKEGLCNPYAARPQTIVDSGLTSNTSIGWGNKIGECGKYAHCPEDPRETSSFMGGYEPPVFWPIGQVEETRSSRARGNYSTIKVKTGKKDVKGKDIMRQVLTKDGVIVTNQDGIEGAQFLEMFDSDEKLLGKAQGRSGFYGGY